MVFQSNSNTIGMGWVGGKLEQLFQSWQKVSVIFYIIPVEDADCYFFLKGYELSLVRGLGEGKLESRYQ